MKKGMISVIMATYNRKHLICEAIDSVLNQTYKNFEIIIIDDCSSDGTGEMISEKYGDIKCISYHRNEKNLGCGISRRNALQNYAKGEFINFLDDDDRFINEKYFEEAIKLFNDNKKVSVVCAPHIVDDVVYKTTREVSFPYKKYVDGSEFLLNFCSEKYPKPIISVAIIRKSMFEKANWQDMKILNDTTIFLRLLTVGDMGFVKKCSAKYTVHGNNISFNCDPDFINDNLEEKLKVYELLKKNKKFDDNTLIDWLYYQMDVTIIYFIRGSKPNYFQFRKVLNWYKKNVKNKQRVNYYKEVYKESKGKEKFI